MLMCAIYLTYHIHVSPGERLRGFEVRAARFEGEFQYQTCGPNALHTHMKTGEVKTFPCWGNPISSHVTIAFLKRLDYLTLCEVAIYGDRTYML